MVLKSEKNKNEYKIEWSDCCGINTEKCNNIKPHYEVFNDEIWLNKNIWKVFGDIKGPFSTGLCPSCYKKTLIKMQNRKALKIKGNIKNASKLIKEKLNDK